MKFNRPEQKRKRSPWALTSAQREIFKLMLDGSHYFTIGRSMTNATVYTLCAGNAIPLHRYYEHQVRKIMKLCRPDDFKRYYLNMTKTTSRKAIHGNCWISKTAKKKKLENSSKNQTAQSGSSADH